MNTDTSTSGTDHALVPRRYTDVRAALQLSYEEEISGAAYFAHLASLFEGRPHEALMLLARIEAVTAAAIRPLVVHYGIEPQPSATLRAAGRAEAERRRGQSWAMLVAEMARDFPAYVVEFDEIIALAPAEDRAGLAVLRDHEVAAVDFAQMERAGDPGSLSPLHDFLARYQVA